jgi:hypothetical protein
VFLDWVIGVANAKKIFKDKMLVPEELLKVLPERVSSAVISEKISSKLEGNQGIPR